MHYWNIQAVNQVTGQTVKQQDLRGQLTTDSAQAQLLAEAFAASLTARTRQSWTAKIVWCESVPRQS